MVKSPRRWLQFHKVIRNPNATGTLQTHPMRAQIYTHTRESTNTNSRAQTHINTFLYASTCMHTLSVSLSRRDYHPSPVCWRCDAHECMHTLTHMHMHTQAHTHAHVNTRKRTTQVNTKNRTHTHAWSISCVSIHQGVIIPHHTQPHTHTHIHIHIHIHIYIYTCKYIYIYIYI